MTALVKFPHKPTDEQAAIVQAAVSSEDSLLISALAGAAKTSTLVLIAEALPKIPILSIAFNKRIADEMKERLPSNVQANTINSIGHRVWATSLGKKLIVNTKKSYEILTEAVSTLKGSDKSNAYETFADTLRSISSAKLNGYVPAGKFPTANRLILADAFFASFEEEPSDLQISLIDRVIEASIQQGYNGKIDFDDQIFLPTIFGGTFPRFPLVLVDEAQDLSPLNHAMLEKLVTKRIIAVGDRHQCQPTGTKVTVVRSVANRWNPRQLEQIPIENIVVGDAVVGFDLDYSEFMFNQTVKNISSRYFQGNLIVVETDKARTRYTPNHKCLINFNLLRKRVALYLMKGAGGRYRVGISNMSYQSAVGPIHRAQCEKAEALWILATYETRKEAYGAEAAVQAAFGIPDITFEWAGVETKGYASKIALQQVWDRLANIDFESRAIDLLITFGRDHNYPLWTNKMTYLSMKRPIFTEACNIMNDCSLLPFNGQKKREKREDWIPCIIGREPYSGMVYSLSVDKTETYVADGITTHNSIYGFRGADTNSMDNLQSRFKMREMTLSTSFRCPKEVVRLARNRAPNMQYPEWAIEGLVDSPEQWPASAVPDGAAIICRNNAPLFKCAMRLIRLGRGVKLVGTELGPQLVKALKKLGDPKMSQDQTLTAIDAWETERLRKSRAKAATSDKAECLRVFASFGENLSAAIAYAEHLFSSNGPIQLMSGHKSKGLEFDTVYFLNPDLIPSKWSTTESELDQEENLRYVITTRAKKELHFVQLDGLVE